MKPFLSIPFSQSELLKSNPQIPYTLSEWYIYKISTYSNIVNNPLHAAIDYDVPYGTSIYSPVDWYITSSYNIQRARQTDWSISQQNWTNATYSLWYCTQIYDPQTKLFLLFGHLSYISRAVPFVPPISNDAWEQFARWFNLTSDHIANIDTLWWVRPITKWDYIWDVWVSGIYITDKLITVDDKPRDRLSIDDYLYYSNPHLHRNTYTRDADWSKQTPIDIYDIYGAYIEYPDPTRPSLPIWSESLMILWPDGLPVYTRE